ncbi:MAG TPA: thioredoxin domain-containing protein, partial [Actinomycetota bacterium]|nr:thioredoxin domain-containing protein [Actinomycetota bacterium]
MDAVQAMTGAGGWPMSVFLTPDGRPFYAGTYFPDEPRHGMPAFRQVLEGIADAWATRRDEVEVQGARVTEAIARAGRLEATDAALDATVEAEAFARLRGAFDARWGGFGGAPKFPQPMTLEFVLRMALRGEPDALEMLVLTLDRMAAGGMFDQLGGGFARYSTDGAWLVPHFEKMLYDNAQLVQLYTRAWQVTGEERLRTVAARTIEYLLRELRQPMGGFSSSQDADSEGAEGRFFTWTWDELVARVGEPVAEAFGAAPEGNWDGTNVLRAPSGLDALADRHGLDEEELRRAVEDARTALFAAREERVHPGVDDKVLTAWNALAIRALAEAGRAFDEPRYTDAALTCARFVREHLRDGDGRLLRSWRDGRAAVPAFADDHALLAGAYLTLYETTFDPAWFVEARELAAELLRSFADEERGGFFQTGSGAERLVVRAKDLADNAVPGGNSAAAETLLRLARFTGDAAEERAAVRALAVVREAMAGAPTGFGTGLCALDLLLGPTREIAIVGDPEDPATRALIEVATHRFRPNAVLAVAAPHDAASIAVVPLLAGRAPVEGRPAAYVCERFACELPVTDPAALAASLA